MSDQAAPFEGCVFLGMSVDGFIARPDGDQSWLESRGEAAGDVGFMAFLATVDALVMGRGTYAATADVEQWPYGDLPVHVLTGTLASDVDPRVTVHRDLAAVVAAVTGCRRVYVDGGQTVRAFLDAGLVAEMTLSRVPVLIGQGATLFGPLAGDVALEHVRTEVLPGGMVQTTYRVLPAGQAPLAEDVSGTSA